MKVAGENQIAAAIAKKHGKVIYQVSIVFLTMLVLTAFVHICILPTRESTTEATFYSEAASAVILLFSFILYLSCYLRGFYKTGKDAYFALAVFFLSVLIFACFAQGYCHGRKELVHLEYMVHHLTALFSGMTYLMFWFYHLEELPKTRREKWFTAVISVTLCVYILLYIISFKTGLMLDISPEKTVVFPGLVIDYSAAGIFEVLYVISVSTARIPLKKKLVMISFSVLPVFCLLLDILYSFVFEITWYWYAGSYAFILMSCYLIFINTVNEGKEALLIREKQLTESKKKQTELQTAIMLSQIQPHFLYNALTAIRVLCRQDPARADEAIVDFSRYLRENMDCLQSDRPIPFTKELSHIRTYLNIEKMRFGDALAVAYEIECDDFAIPALTVQPLVENAVRHGICQNENGGTVTVRTRRDGDEIRICVTDDGPGFDPSKRPEDGNSHIGIENARARLKSMVGGELAVTSAPGAGTTVTIVLKEATI